MAAKYYTWSPIRTGEGEVKAGTVVTAKDFGADWDDLVECGAISTKVYPKMPATFTGSVRSWRNEQLRKIKMDDPDLDLDEEEDDGEVVAA
jgi:hypothetical protein